MRSPPKPKNTRNGLIWRDGRPRWEPSPASRKAGLKGLDLKDLDGNFLQERGDAIAVCDQRHQWAAMIRETALDGPAGAEAADTLRNVLNALQPPSTPEGRQRRALLADLIDAARVALDGVDVNRPSTARGVRTAEALTEAYFAAVDSGEVKLKSGSRRAYHAQRIRFETRFAGRAIGGITRAELRDWYHQDLKLKETASTANLCMGAVAAWFRFAWDKEWIPASPAAKLGLVKASGRRVSWTWEEEQFFIPWCDANKFEDVADGVVAGLWAGARLSDICAANLEQLTGGVWRFTPIKTEDKSQEAMPGITEAFQARITRRRAEADAGALRHLDGATPFLWNRHMNRRHDIHTYWLRFKKAKALALLDPACPKSLAGKKHQDTRDTCITRLFEADVAPTRMWTWTGHSQDSIQDIVKEHYIVLREAGQRDMAAKLEAWAAREGVAI